MVANLRIAFVSTIRKFVMISYSYQFYLEAEHLPATAVGLRVGRQVSALSTYRPAFRSQELAAIGLIDERL